MQTQSMKRIIAILSILLVISLIYDVRFYRKSKIFREDIVARNERDAKIRADFANTKISRAAVYNHLKIDSSDIVFLGNSLTEAFPVTEYFENIHVKNRGVSGYLTKEVLENMGNVLKSYPKKIFIEIGINDIKYGLSDKPKMTQELLDNYNKILRNIRKDCPRTEVYVQSILPINKIYDPNVADTINTIIIDVNSGIKELAEKYNYHFIDLYTRFAENNCLPVKYTTDGIHLNETAYELWAATIKKDVN
jgi:lysophospholipase L1-like esterase